MLARLHSAGAPLVGSPAPCSRRTAASRGDGSFLQQPRQQEQCGSCRGVATCAAGGSADGGRPPRVSFRQPRAKPSSWNAKEAGGGRSAESDYLSELGAAQQVGGWLACRSAAGDRNGPRRNREAVLPTVPTSHATAAVDPLKRITAALLLLIQCNAVQH